VTEDEKRAGLLMALKEHESSGETLWSGIRRRQRRLVILLVIGLGLAILAQSQLQRLKPAVRTMLSEYHVHRHRDVLLQAAEESGVDPYLLAAMMCAESSGRIGVRSTADALGLFQLRMPTAKERARLLKLPEPTEEDLLSDPLLNARLGADYMRWLLKYNDGDVERSLVAYNTGPTRLNRYIREAGSWEAWRGERAAAGDSQLLAYARKVMISRDHFAKKGLLD